MIGVDDGKRSSELQALAREQLDVLPAEDFLFLVYWLATWDAESLLVALHHLARRGEA